MKSIVLWEITSGQSFTIYALEIGTGCDTWEFLNDLEATNKNECDKMLALLSWSAEDGPPKNYEKCNPVGDSVFEFKTKRARICWFYDEGQMIICTHGFLKGASKVQNREIKSAKKIRSEYFEKKKAGVPIDRRKRGGK